MSPLDGKAGKRPATVRVKSDHASATMKFHSPEGTPLQLYCQNLSLFGKLFIDIKTLFFDCDNCASSAFTLLP